MNELAEGLCKAADGRVSCDTVAGWIPEQLDVSKHRERNVRA